MSTWHVTPINDLIEHEDSDDCACLPKTEPVVADDGSINWVTVHAAWDGRE